MATVWYECWTCDHTWHEGPNQACPKCGALTVHTEWDEANDFAHCGEHLDSDTFEADENEAIP